MLNHYIKISPEVSEALNNQKPVVALESTIIAHGMPYPQKYRNSKGSSKHCKRKWSNSSNHRDH